MTPREVVDQLLRLTAQGPTTSMADLFAEDVHFEMPFLPPGTPQPPPGREEFRKHLTAAAGVQKFHAIDDVQVHETADPDVIVAEYRLHGEVLATGKRYTSPAVMVVRVRDGLITWSRNYSNPLAVPA